MTKYVIALLTVIQLTHGQNPKADNRDLFKSLSTNYTLLPRGDVKMCSDITDAQFTRDSLAYQNARMQFFMSDKTTIDLLLKYEKDTLRYNNWIKSPNPCSSKLVNKDFLTNSEAALILIDNYLSRADFEEIRIASYNDILSYSKVRSFYEANKHLPVGELRILYSEWIFEHTR